MANNKLIVQLSAGRIKRYHTHPIVGEQTVGDHTYGVVQILRYITQDNCSKNLMIAALDHDVLEFFTGDVPHPAKNMFPQLKQVLDAIERNAAEVNGMVEYDKLSAKEKVLLTCADLLEMGFYGAYQMKLGNSFGRNVVETIVQSVGKLPENKVPKEAKDLAQELEEMLNVGK